MGPNLEIDILTRYLADEADQEERRLVDSWISESEENRDRLRKLEKIWTTSALGKGFDQEMGWQEIRNEIKPHGKVRSLHLAWNTPLRIAAAVTLLVGISWLVTFYLPDGSQSLLAGNEILRHSLMEGSTITLNQKSGLDIEEGFGKDHRRVTLQGEAYFEVEPADQPFIITVGSAQVQVVGTEFNVRQNSGNLDVSVFEGIVEISYLGTVQRVNGGQSIQMSGDDLRFNLKSLNQNDIFWKTGRLSFKNVPLATAIEEISLRFDKLMVLDSSITDCYISTEFNQTSLEDVLAIIASMYNLDVTEENQVITLSGPGCD